LGFIFGLVLVGILLVSWNQTREVRSFIYNPTERLVEYIVRSIKSDTMGKKEGSDRFGPKGLVTGDFHLFLDSPRSMDGTFSFFHSWFRTTQYFEKAQINIEDVKDLHKKYLKELILTSKVYLILAIMSLIAIVYFLLHWFVVPDWELDKTIYYASNMVFRGTPFGIAEYFLGSSFQDLPSSKNLSYIKLFANFWTSVIVIGGLLQILALMFRRRKLEDHFHGRVGKIHFVAMFLLFARDIEESAVVYKDPENIIGGDEGIKIFEKKMKDWHKYKKKLIKSILEEQLRIDEAL